MQTRTTFSELRLILAQLARAIRGRSLRHSLEALGALTVGVVLAGARFVGRLTLLFVGTVIVLIVTGLLRRWAGRLLSQVQAIRR